MLVKMTGAAPRRNCQQATMDPITLGALASMALSGIVGNRADYLFCRASSALYHKLREGTAEPGHGDLSRAIRRSQVLAVELGVTFYARLSHPNWRDLPGYSPEDIITPFTVWTKQGLRKDDPWTANQEQQSQTEARMERAFTDPEPHDGPAARRHQELRDIALDLTLTELRQLVPTAPDWPRFETLLRQDGDPTKGEYPGWWRTFRAFLAEEIKHSESVRAFLAEQGIVRILDIQSDLTGAVATLQTGLDSMLAQLTPALTDLRSAASDLGGSADRIEAALRNFDDASNRLVRLVTTAIDENARAWFGIQRNDGKETPRVERIKDRPTELLIARYCIVPFVDRGGRLAELYGWAIDTARPRAQGRLYVAPGGAGKTRLGIELIDALHRRGWRTTFLSQRNGLQLPPGAMADNMRADTVSGICIVLDYAESQIPTLDQIAQAAALADQDGPPIRILALARSAEGWWEEFAGRTGVDVVFDRTPRQNIAGALDAEERQTLFGAARAAFVKQRRAHGLTVREPASPPDLSAADSPLLVAANAYLDAADVDPRPRQSVFQVLFEEEQRHWLRITGAAAADEVEAVALARAATQVTLVLGATEKGALALIRADPFAAAVDPRETLRQLRRLYGRNVLVSGPGQEAPSEFGFVAPIEPDLLGEHAAMTVLARDTDGLLAVTLRTALGDVSLFAENAAAILLVLIRAMHPAHEQTIGALAARAIDSIAVNVPKLSAGEVERLYSVLPIESVALLELSAIIAQHAVASSPADNSNAGLAERAQRQSNLGVRLSNLGRREEALAPSKEAARLYRELVDKGHDAFLPNLARALSNLSNRLAEVGLPEGGLAASEEAVRLRRELVEKKGDAFLPALAAALTNLGNRLSDLKRHKDALAVSKEATCRFRKLVGKRRDSFLRNLARALNNLGIRLSALGQREEALAAIAEAVCYYRELVDKNRDAFLPDLAGALGNLGPQLSSLSRFEEALAASEEAVRHYRELVGKNRGAFLPEVARALAIYGSVLLAAGQADRAADAFAKAIEASARLIRPHRAAIDDLLGALISNLSRALRATGREVHIGSVIHFHVNRTANDDDRASPALARAHRLFMAWVVALQAWSTSPSEPNKTAATQCLAGLQSHLDTHASDGSLTPIRETVPRILQQRGPPK